jgi:hypothetical protein
VGKQGFKGMYHPSFQGSFDNMLEITQRLEYINKRIRYYVQINVTVKYFGLSMKYVHLVQIMIFKNV